MRRILPIAFLALLSACSAANVPPVGQEPAAAPTPVPVAEEPADLFVRLEKNVTTDDQATPHTNAVIHLTGAVQADIPLPETLGELMYVDQNAYQMYQQDNVQAVVAVLSSWWAGQGREFVLTKLAEPHMFKVEMRNGYEEGVCDPPEVLAEAELPGMDTPVVLEGFDSPVERSSVEFCHAQ